MWHECDTKPSPGLFGGCRSICASTLAQLQFWFRREINAPQHNPFCANKQPKNKSIGQLKRKKKPKTKIMATTFNGEHWDNSKTIVCVKPKTNKNTVRYISTINCQFYPLCAAVATSKAIKNLKFELCVSLFLVSPMCRGSSMWKERHTCRMCHSRQSGIKIQHLQLFPIRSWWAFLVPI